MHFAVSNVEPLHATGTHATARWTSFHPPIGRPATESTWSPGASASKPPWAAFASSLGSTHDTVFDDGAIVK